MKSQLVALWALASWNLSVSRVDAQIELISAWTMLLQLALYHAGDESPIPKALATDAQVRHRGPCSNSLLNATLCTLLRRLQSSG